MCIGLANTLRVGEQKRDATDKVRGFLFQDLVAIREILSHDDSYKCYIEWVEDIFLESENDVKIIQVKYYPGSDVQFYDIVSDLYFQLIKSYIFTDINKKIKTYCYHHSSTIYNDDVVMERLKKQCIENMLDESKKKKIIEEFGKTSKHQDRKELLLKKASNQKIMDSYKFETINFPAIGELKEEVSDKIFEYFNKDGELEDDDEDQIKKVLISVAIQFIQDRYYTKEEEIAKRVILKSELLGCMQEVLENKMQNISSIKFIVIECIDSIFEDILREETGPDRELAVSDYEKIYIETKRYFNEVLENQRRRFKFINTISNHLNINWKEYENYKLTRERDLFLKNSECVKAYIRYLWKLIFNHEKELNNFNLHNYILEVEDYFLLNYGFGSGHEVFLGSEIGTSNPVRKLENIFNRFKNSTSRPDRWYLQGKIKGTFYYSYDISQIKDLYVGTVKGYSIDEIDLDEKESFNIKCMDCIRIDDGEMGKKDSINCSFLKNYCQKGVKGHEFK